MSDSYPKQRALPGSLDFRARDNGPEAEASDPLAELARLVGRDDPFRDLFPARTSKTAPARDERPAGPPMLPAPEPFDHHLTQDAFGAAPAYRDAQDGYQGGTSSYRGSVPLDEEDELHSPLGRKPQNEFRLPMLPGDAGSFDDQAEHAYQGHGAGEAPPLNADLWAQGMPEPVSSDPMAFASPVEDAELQTDHPRRRTLVVLLAVLALTAGGLGATFLVRGGGTSGATAGTPPTILADTGPTKIQPPDTSNQATGGDGNTALIEKSASDNVNNAKVVNTQERPVDLAQLPKAPAVQTPQVDDGRVAVSTTAGGAGASAFPEPRRVKTVLIRPDGSVVGEDTSAALAPAAGDPGAATTPGGAITEAVPRPATPKATTRATATPKAASTTPSDSAPVKPKPPVHQATAKPKPAAVQTADATPPADAAPTADAAAASTGAFAVQLAAPPSEQEAKDVSARLQKKFASELDGHAPSIHKAGDKSVYRVRVGNMSQADAKALCTKLQASGGSCFVVRN